MNWVTSISRALDYTEKHLCEKIDFGAVAKEAYSSEFHFQRMFSMLCGYTLGDYIRMRRLSLAAEELLNTNAKVIDVAYKYGYDTPESFSRAFSRFHGVTPSEAKANKKVKSFSRLYVKLILTGGTTMDYRIVSKQAISVVCKRVRVNKPQGETATADISAFWQKCNKDGTMKKLCKYAKFDNLNGILGICFSGEMADDGFPYGIGAEYNGVPVTDKDLDVVEIPAYTYAVFQCKGKMPDAFVETYSKICTDFFPQSNYEYGSGIELEVYPSDDVANPDYSCEIWIAVNEK